MFIQIGGLRACLSLSWLQEHFSRQVLTITYRIIQVSQEEVEQERLPLPKRAGHGHHDDSSVSHVIFQKELAQRVFC